MINLAKIKYEKCQPPLFRKPAPAPYFHPLFLIFRFPHLQMEVIKIYSLPIKKKERGVQTMT